MFWRNQKASLKSLRLARSIIPFWIFPDWLRGVAEILPFKAIYFTPISLYMGTMPVGEALAFQGAWLLALVLLSQGLWKLMMRRIVVQGG